MAKENVISTLTRNFALRIIRLYKYLTEEKKEHIIAKQIYRSGTSIGANVAESLYAQSKADYVHKLRIALQEASETEYWLYLLKDSNLIEDKAYESIEKDIKTIIGTLINIINKVRVEETSQL